MKVKTYKLYDLNFTWDNTCQDINYKQYCAETISNVFEYDPNISVKILYEGIQNGVSLICSTPDKESIIIARNILLSLEVPCEIKTNIV